MIPWRPHGGVHEQEIILKRLQHNRQDALHLTGITMLVNLAEPNSAPGRSTTRFDR
jgi:hypothetical protein